MKRCSNYLPVTPWDQIGPRVRPGLTQLWLGGPFVIRGNPIGAIFDNVRRFCAPLEQREIDGDGTFVAEDDAYNSPSLSPFDLAQDIPQQSYFGDFESGPAQPSANGSCGVGTVWDGGIGACVPVQPASAGSTPSPASLRKALSDATSRKDCEGVRQVLDNARQYRGSKTSALYRSYQSVAIAAKEWLGRNNKVCR